MNKKIFRVEGYITKNKIVRTPRKKEGKITKKKVIIRFRKEIVATKPEEAIEKLYSIYGSVHRVKRNGIKIISIKEIPFEEVKDIQLKKFIKAVENGEI